MSQDSGWGGPGAREGRGPSASLQPDTSCVTIDGHTLNRIANLPGQLFTVLNNLATSRPSTPVPPFTSPLSSSYDHTVTPTHTRHAANDYASPFATAPPPPPPLPTPFTHSTDKGLAAALVADYDGMWPDGVEQHGDTSDHHTPTISSPTPHPIRLLSSSSSSSSPTGDSSSSSERRGLRASQCKMTKRRQHTCQLANRNSKKHIDPASDESIKKLRQKLARVLSCDSPPDLEIPPFDIPDGNAVPDDPHPESVTYDEFTRALYTVYFKRVVGKKAMAFTVGGLQSDSFYIHCVKELYNRGHIDSCGMTITQLSMRNAIHARLYRNSRAIIYETVVSDTNSADGRRTVPILCMVKPEAALL
ncbi:hypothetical protein MMC34_008458, partial [Xylographa carneopallida]|nr:hypothetical protein [Xylographa carneopallida]